MDFDLRWEALTKPGKGTYYFDRHAERPFEPQRSDYCAINAWWLSELSRWIYKQEEDETNRAELKDTRKRILRDVGLFEKHFISTSNGTQCALVVPAVDAESPDYAVLVFRGSHEIKDWITNFKFFPVGWPGPGRVHWGFRDAVESVWDDVQDWLNEISRPVFYTGHSLGAALATLAAVRRPPHALYAFGSPRVGNRVFARALSDIPAYRVQHHRDIVSRVPPWWLGFRHGCQLHYLANDGRHIVEPAKRDVVVNHWKKSTDGQVPIRRRKGCNGPSGPFSDHAPVNYVARLERVV